MNGLLIITLLFLPTLVMSQYAHEDTPLYRGPHHRKELAVHQEQINDGKTWLDAVQPANRPRRKATAIEHGHTHQWLENLQENVLTLFKLILPGPIIEKIENFLSQSPWAAFFKKLIAFAQDLISQMVSELSGSRVRERSVHGDIFTPMRQLFGWNKNPRNE